MRALAIHEAGHVIAAWALGFEVREATLAPAQRSAAGVTYASVTGTARQRLTVLLAGQLATVMYGIDDRGGSANDLASCDRISDSQVIRGEAHRDAAHLVVQHRDRISRVAAALLERRRLLQSDLEELLR